MWKMTTELHKGIFEAYLTFNEGFEILVWTPPQQQPVLLKLIKEQLLYGWIMTIMQLHLLYFIPKISTAKFISYSSSLFKNVRFY